MENVVKSHTVSSYDNELKTISADLIKMSELVGDIISVFIETITLQSDENLVKVRNIDTKVNDLDEKIEKISTTILALRNPLAIDLRFVISAIKISTIIERQGDMVKAATKKLLEIDREVVELYKEELTSISKKTFGMLINSVQGFSNHSTDDANKVWRAEDKVDNIADESFVKIKAGLTGDIKGEKTDDYISLMLIIKSFERLGDYCTKITKAVHYVESGKRVSEKDF